MKLLVDTGVFSAALSQRRRPEFDPLVARLPGNQLNLAAQSVAELRYRALFAGWGSARADRLERAIETVNVIRVSAPLVRRRPVPVRVPVVVATPCRGGCVVRGPEARLLLDHGSGEHDPGAAIEVGVSPDVGYRWMRQAGLSALRKPPRGYSAEEKAEIFRLLASLPHDARSRNGTSAAATSHP
ncbi:MAG: hypothetical protein LH624_17520 [Cryobacterium sp.]|nr:hypothetical protein [Cryobacterium sp.]